MTGRAQKINDLKLCKKTEARGEKKKEWKFNREVGESSEETVKEVEEKRDRTKITAD